MFKFNIMQAPEEEKVSGKLQYDFKSKADTDRTNGEERKKEL